jgi:hypothetical protein
MNAIPHRRGARHRHIAVACRRDHHHPYETRESKAASYVVGIRPVLPKGCLSQETRQRIAQASESNKFAAAYCDTNSSNRGDGHKCQN